MKRLILLLLLITAKVYCQTDTFIAALPNTTTIDSTYLFIAESPTTTYKLTWLNFRNAIWGTQNFWSRLNSFTGAFRIVGRDTAKQDYIYTKTVGGTHRLMWRRSDAVEVPLDSLTGGSGTIDTTKIPYLAKANIFTGTANYFINHILLGQTNTTNGKIDFYNSSNSYITSMTAPNATGDITITSPNLTGTLALTSIAGGGTNATAFTDGKFIRFNGTKLISSGKDSTSFEVPLTFNSPLSRSVNTISFLFNTSNVWTSQNYFVNTTFLGQTTTTNGTLSFYNSSNSFITSLSAPNATADRLIALPNIPGNLISDGGSYSDPDWLTLLNYDKLTAGGGGSGYLYFTTGVPSLKNETYGQISTDNTWTGDLKFTDDFINPWESFTAASMSGDTLDVTGKTNIHYIGTGNITIAKIIPIGIDGKTITITNQVGNTITINENVNIDVPGGTSIVLGNFDVITFVFYTYGSYNHWICTNYLDN